jgi:hypothetical protein
MNKFSRIVVIVTALASLFAVLSSTAGAVTWTNTGGTPFHATGGPSTLAVTGSGGTNNLTCFSSTATGTVAMDFATVTGTVTYPNCSLGVSVDIGCTYTLVPTGHSGTVPNVTTGTMVMTCIVSLTTGTALCHIQGSTPAHYVNPVLASSTVGRVTLTPSSSLTVTNSSGLSCSFLLGTFTSATGHLSEQTLNLTGPASGNPFIVSS